MDADQELAALSEELQQKIGRNLLNYQVIEQLLKFLISRGHASAALHELDDAFAQNAEAVQHKTMGQLAGQFCDDFLSDAGNTRAAKGDEAKISITFSVRFERSADENAALRQVIERLVDNRNDLAHHFGTRWDRASKISARKLIGELDKQREQQILVHQALRELVLGLVQGLRDHAELFQCQETIETLVLCQSPLVGLLVDCARERARPDGWTLLSRAGDILRANAPEHAASFRKNFGHKTLKQFVAATGLFDIRDEALDCGFRTLYRCNENVRYPD